MDLLAHLGKEVLYTLVLSMPRIIGAMTGLAFMGSSVLGGTLARNGVAAALAIIVYPVVSDQLATAGLSHLAFAGAAVKEFLLGMVIGTVLMVVFWGIQAVGDLIDNQRGATMASSFDPMVGEQTSPLALFMVQSLIAVFFCSGLFLVFLEGIYLSYEVWPVTSFWPSIDRHVVDFFVTQFTLISLLAVIVGGPVVIAMFFAELGLGFVGRFAPQLNVFFLSMPIKSAVAALVLILCWTLLILYFSERLEGTEAVGLLRGLWPPGES